MKTKPFVFFLFAFMFMAQFGKSQVNSNFCQRMQTIIDEAGNGTFINIRGTKWTDMNSETYNSTVSLTNNAYISQFGKDIWTFAESPSYDDKDFIPYLNTLKSCLTAPDWVLCDESFSSKKEYIFKNLRSRVFVSISNHPTGVYITVYLQKNSTAKCLWGNCQNGYGSYQFENNDIYTGDFINGYRNGRGVYSWASTGQYYDGSWLNGKMNGPGAIYKSDSTLTYEGFMYQDQWLNVDFTKTTSFTKGDTNNGFGMIYNNGKYQICNHKEGKPNGISLIDDGNQAFGYYQNGFNGYCIVYYSNGNSFYGNFENGSIKGKGVQYLKNNIKLEGYFETNSANVSRFDENGFLIQKESWLNGKQTIDHSVSTQSAINFAKSLSYICLTGPDQLRDKELDSDFTQTYSSKYKLNGAAQTEIVAKNGSFVFYVESKMNSTKLSKEQALAQYNAVIEKVKNCIDSGWKGEETENKDSNDNLFRVYTFSNSMYYYSFEIKCWFNDIDLNIMFN